LTILQLMPQCPLPATDGGKVGLWGITRHMAMAGHTVIVLCYGDAQVPLLDLQGIHLTVIPHSTRNTPWRIVKSLFTADSLYLRKHKSQAMQEAIRAVIGKYAIDVIHADHTCMTPLAQWASNTFDLPWGFRLHNVEWMIWHRYAESLSVFNPTRWYVSWQARKVQWEEADALRQAAIVFPVTETDLQRAQVAAQSTPMVVAPAGVDVPAGPPMHQQHCTTELVTAANWNWFHNADALRWFIQQVWPLLRQDPACNNISLGILGMGIQQWMHGYTAVNIQAEGFVPDLRKRYQESRVFIAPLFVGSGIRVKILEAMAAGLPVVATSVSAEGIQAGEADGLFRCDTTESTVHAIRKLLSDSDLLQRASVAATNVALTRYSWQNSVAVMLREYEVIAAGHGR